MTKRQVTDHHRVLERAHGLVGVELADGEREPRECGRETIEKGIMQAY